MIAHGSLATVDAAYAATVAATLACAAAWGRAPSAARAAAVGLALGLALVAKFSALFLVPGLAVTPFLFRDRAPGARTMAAHIAILAGVAWLVVASWYLFLEVGRPLGTIEWRSGPLRALAAAVPGLPSLVPAAFLTGVDHSLADERGEWGTVLLGRRHPQGVWFYFAALWLLKTPLLVLAAQVAGYAAAWRRLRADPVARLLAWNLALHLAYFSLVFRAQLGYRFVLMLVPLGYVLAAAGLATGGVSPRARRLLAVVALVAAGGEPRLRGQPARVHQRGRAAEAAGLPARGRLQHRLGPDRARASRGRWPAAAPGTPTSSPLHVVPGHNTLGLNAVAGVHDYERHRWVRENLEPGGHFDHTYLWYEIDAATYDRFLDADAAAAARSRGRPPPARPTPPSSTMARASGCPSPSARRRGPATASWSASRRGAAWTSACAWARGSRASDASTPAGGAPGRR